MHRCRLPFLDVTIGLVAGATGVLLIDTGSTLAEAAAIAADVRQLAANSVTHVVLTHRHFDHVLGSSVFADAELYCAPEVAECLASGTELLRAEALHCGAAAHEIDRAIAALRPPNHLVKHATLDLGERSVAITHPGPGHTGADLVVLIPGAGDDGRAVVFTGDLVEESDDPQFDHDSDAAAWPSTLDRVLALGGPDAIYVPGHGRAVNAGFLRQQRDWLATQATRKSPQRQSP